MTSVLSPGAAMYVAPLQFGRFTKEFDPGRFWLCETLSWMSQWLGIFPLLEHVT